jgi:prevent-host-death family protein
LTIFIFELPQGRGEHRSSWAWTQQPHHAADRGWRKAALDGLPLNAYLTGQFDQSKLTMADENRRGFGEGAPQFEHSAAAPRELREVQASVAKAHFSQLLDEVERGQNFVILRHGRPVARLTPDPDGRQRRTTEAIANIKRLAKERAAEFGPVTVEEIISSIHEGHKY